VAGDSAEIGTLFKRIERYMVRISGDANVLDFSDYRKDDRTKLNSSLVGGGLDSTN
jgi:predicted GTPase